eukprot:TRINITY_DN1024_c0_g1_i1.p1 TRINITY_DN1024_c0_g1~~TRINITY_DN1024_c0_g1_i1.p1  ORF type:complete len:858 (-),score=217.69 TRINITY_DN1024_c0_g1_i1:308-2881(-)
MAAAALGAIQAGFVPKANVLRYQESVRASRITGEGLGTSSLYNRWRDSGSLSRGRRAVFQNSQKNCKKSITCSAEADRSGQEASKAGGLFKKGFLTLAGISAAGFCGRLLIFNNGSNQLVSGGDGGDGFGAGGRGFGGGDGNGNGGDDFRLRLDSGLAAAKVEEDDEEGEEEEEEEEQEVPPVQFDDEAKPHGMRVGVKVPVNRLDPNHKYKCSKVEWIDLATNQPVDPNDPFVAEATSARPGATVTKQLLEEELDRIKPSGMFDEHSLSLDAIPEKDGSITLRFQFRENHWAGAQAVQCINVGGRSMPKEGEEQGPVPVTAPVDEEDKGACLLPPRVERDLSKMVSTSSRLTARKLTQIRDRALKWYHENGYVCATVVNFGGLMTDKVQLEVIEGDITRTDIVFQDKMGNEIEGRTNKDVIWRAVPEELKKGNPYNYEAGKKALQKINELGLIANIEVTPKPDESVDGGVIVEIKLKELDPTMAEVNTEWSISPGDSGKPSLVTLFPGGSVTFEHRNLWGLNRSLFGSISTNNLMNPQDDLGFKLEYQHPYFDGVLDPRDRTGRVSCFNSRKLSSVFTGGPSLEEVPAVWIDRAGVKATLTENFTKQSKYTYGAVLEEVTTRDDTSAICTNGSRQLPSGSLTMEGPPTSHTDTGVDHLAFLQANVTRDNTRFVNGTPVGSRYVFQVDQGLGLPLPFFNKLPIYNRHQFTATKFIQLRPEKENPEEPPPVAVLHTKYGGVVGDLASYDAFSLGGPYSVRGYNMGELGACRHILELAGELRVPVFKTHAYAFAEYGTDLGSSKDVRGNPTEFFRRKGSGASWGFGMKLPGGASAIRAEYAHDCNNDTGSIFVRFGERF